MNDLSKQIEDAKKRSQEWAHNKAKKFDQSKVGRFSQDVNMFQRFTRQFWAGCLWIYANIWAPLIKKLAVPAKYLLRQYIKLWFWIVNVPDKYGTLVFSKTRAGMMILSTILFCFLVPTIFETTCEAILFFGTVHEDEVVYLNGSQELNSENGMHAIEGCYKLPCSDEDAIYYRTKNSLLNDIWSLTHGKGLFYPEYVAASIPYNISKCTITSYGIRVRSFIKRFNWFPNLLASTCRPI